MYGTCICVKKAKERERERERERGESHTCDKGVYIHKVVASMLVCVDVFICCC